MKTNALDVGRGRRNLTLLVACLAQSVVILNAMVVFVALASIQQDLQVSSGELTWVVNAYAIMLGGFLLVGGRCADMWGSKKVLIIGLSLFAVASVMCAIAATASWLLAARAAQGLAAALTGPAALSIVTTTFVSDSDRGGALAVWGSMSNGASSIGALLGGLLTDWLSWPFIFVVNVPICVGIAIMAVRYVPERGTRAVKVIDAGGAATVTAGSFAVVFAVVSSQQSGWAAPGTVGAGFLGVVLLVAFVMIQRVHPTPLIGSRILKSRSVIAANVAMFTLAGAPIGITYLATLYLQSVLGYSATQTGVALVPGAVAALLGSLAAHRLIPRLGLRAVLTCALAFAAVGAALLTRTTVGGNYASEIVPALVVMSFGVSCAVVALVMLAARDVLEEDAGLGSGLIYLTQQIGGALGLAVLATLAIARDSAGPSMSSIDLMDGYHIGFWCAALLPVMAAILVRVLLGRVDPMRRRPSMS